MITTRAAGAALAAGLLVLVVGCAARDSGAAAPTPRVEPAQTPPSSAPAPEGVPQHSAHATPSFPSPTPKPAVDPRTTPGSLTIPAIGVRDLKVVPYEGTTDDWPGTRIQDRGVAASPRGERGGVGPGEKGNHLITAHRLSAGGPLRHLPDLDEGDTVRIRLGDMLYTYEITESRWTSFRSERSIEEQRAAVPGKPGETPTQAMITISTCATPEDNAAGNYWRDDRNNPEHRIDKVGTLVSAEKAGGASGQGRAQYSEPRLR
ncbi:sortase [Streptomyces sp. NPDC006458]|uniref:sortase domain-containing protein n=1 Tax=Streptomyces sp. NPDC006458 TaxID=3154302 RepID=UPI0033A05AEB